MKLEGIIHEIQQEENLKNFSKRNLILEVNDGRYTQYLTIEFQQNNTDLLDPYKPGMKVAVSINLRGRKWDAPTGEIKYFNTIVGWRVENLTPQQSNNNQIHETPPADPFNTNNGLEVDDLPF